jgi:hypothetical protein
MEEEEEKEGSVADAKPEPIQTHSRTEVQNQLLKLSSCCEPEIEMSDINLLFAITNPSIANCNVDNLEFFPDLLP